MLEFHGIGPEEPLPPSELVELELPHELNSPMASNATLSGINGHRLIVVSCIS
jgi:hypothetical protein